MYGCLLPSHKGYKNLKLPPQAVVGRPEKVEAVPRLQFHSGSKLEKSVIGPKYQIFGCNLALSPSSEYKGNGLKFENGDASGIWANAIQATLPLFRKMCPVIKCSSLLKCQYYVCKQLFHFQMKDG